VGAKRNTGCRDDRCPNIEICIFKYIRSANVCLTCYKNKLWKLFFFLTLPAFVEFSLGTNAGTTSIQAIFDLCPRVLKRVLGYHSHDIPFASFQLLNIVVFYLEDAVRNRLSHTIPDGWVGKGEPVSWLPRSPDVTPLKFFVLGCVKTSVGSLEEVDQLEDIALDGRIVSFCPPRLRRCVFGRHSRLSTSQFSFICSVYVPVLRFVYQLWLSFFIMLIFSVFLYPYSLLLFTEKVLNSFISLSTSNFYPIYYILFKNFIRIASFFLLSFFFILLWFILRCF
jgi:hypothetical protein